ncbi:hypothetical protein F4X86_04950 [Candidatus Saccharibacteria bacterium]|nr:hypothetical protein [Candidatus Saccharibacteria bacterium]
MKQNILMAVLAAGMLVLAGCGGGGGFSQKDIDEAKEEGKEEGKNSVVQRECREGTMESRDGAGCEDDPGYMSPADTAAMADKLWKAIGENPLGLATADGNNQSGVTVSATTGNPLVHRGGAGGSPVELPKDGDAMVEELAGWLGSRHTDKAPDDHGGGTYTAYLYAGVEEPAEGDMFKDLTGFTGGALPSANIMPANVEIPDFTKSAGSQTFHLKDETDEPSKVVLDGRYRGVSGEYACEPATAENGCSVSVAEDGLALSSGDTWIFVPGDEEDRVMDTPDTAYAVFGWWLYEDANDTDTRVSAFTGVTGTTPPVAAAGITALQGTATYSGGAAGKYAILGESTSESGHFTADATLTADFHEDMVSGTIDRFRVGDDGMPMDGWSVALAASGVSDTGGIFGNDGDNTAGTAKMTTWTMDGTDADAGGEWSGTLYYDTAGGDGGVPKVGTGTFHAEYNNIGRMVGAFGVNLDE